MAHTWCKACMNFLVILNFYVYHLTEIFHTYGTRRTVVKISLQNIANYTELVESILRIFFIFFNSRTFLINLTPIIDFRINYLSRLPHTINQCYYESFY